MCGQCSFAERFIATEKSPDNETSWYPHSPVIFLFVCAGITCWSICCPSGYCFVQSVDGGFKLDKKLRPHENCPLGRTARTLLYVALEACPEFSTKIVNSGVTIAMDNYFTSAALLLALATRDIFVVGTLRSNRSGLDGAEQLWAKHAMVVVERGDMAMARAGELVVIKWMDTNEVRLMTTRHIFESDWVPMEYT